MTIILDQKKYDIPNVRTVSWLDPEAGALGLKQVSHSNARTTWLRGIVCHTIHGVLGKLLPGAGPNTDVDVLQAHYQVSTDRAVSWDFTCDMDGTWLIQNDPVKRFTWQAGAVNPFTCGFEMVQYQNGDLFEVQIAKAVEFIDFLTLKLGIQRQIPWDKKNNCPKKGIVNRIAGNANGANVVGIYAHYNQTTNRGYGDPGPYLFEALKAAGYETFDFDSGDDLAAWKERQINLLGIAEKDADGVPGQKTVAALKSKGYKTGLWVQRPMDQLLT